jgi:hypothetical protein
MSTRSSHILTKRKMLVQVVLVCLFANVLSVNSDENVVVDILRPRSKSLEAHNEQIRSFWTSEKLKAATPVDKVRTNVPNSRTASKNSTGSVGSASHVSGSIPENNATKSKGISSGGRQVYTTGRVFWQVGSSYYSCSGSVVSSKSDDLIATAEHCVYDTDTKQWYANNNWVFVPAYSNGNAPYGTWAARRLTVKQAWTASADFNYDVGFVAVSTVNSRHIQSVVGSQGIAFNQPRLAYTYSFGYPANLDSGRYLKSCAGNTQKTR